MFSASVLQPALWNHFTMLAIKAMNSGKSRLESKYTKQAFKQTEH